MRPGQTAPECPYADIMQAQIGFASMRPGQTAPECKSKEMPIGRICTGFNEAGADCPGMRFRQTDRDIGTREASMRPGQTAPECVLLHGLSFLSLRKLQ